MANESSPLISNGSDDDRRINESNAIGASFQATTINITKVCMGTGILALPYAASRGGYLFYIVGLIGMYKWNIYSVDRMLKCHTLLTNHSKSEKEYISKDRKHRRLQSYQKEFQKQESEFLNESEFEKVIDLNEELADVLFVKAPPGTSTFGKIAWAAGGNFGLILFDWIMLILLTSVVIAYIDASLSFIESTPFTSGSRLQDSLWNVIIIAYLSCLPDVGFLAKFSAFGLSAILVTFLMISIYGLDQYGFSGFTSHSTTEWSDMLLPKRFSDITSLFGIVAFSFGLTPIVFNVQESMVEPSLMLEATRKGLSLASIVYAIVGVYIAILFSPGDSVFNGDALQHLPSDKIYAVVIRVAMAVMVTISSPLLLIPCSEILDGKLISSSDATSLLAKYTIRIGISIFCAIIAATVPDFVHIVSFIGGCFVSLITFTVPPFLYLTLIRKEKQLNTYSKHKTDRRSFLIDQIMLLLGLAATIVASFLTFDAMLKAMVQDREGTALSGSPNE